MADGGSTEIKTATSADIKSSTVPATIMTAAYAGIFGAIAYAANKPGLALADVKDTKLFFIAYVIYMLILYVLLFRQGMSKAVLNKELVGSDDPAWLTHEQNLDRSALNAVEQATLFVPVAMIYAAFVNAHTAGILILVYCVFLVLYPIFFSIWRSTGVPWIVVSTLPRYWIVFYMMASFVVGALRMVPDDDSHSHSHNSTASFFQFGIEDFQGQEAHYLIDQVVASAQFVSEDFQGQAAQYLIDEANSCSASATYAWLPTGECASEIQHCYEGSKADLLAVVKNKRVNPCLMNSMVKAGTCSSHGWESAAASMTEDSSLQGVTLWEVSRDADQ